jgi:hypothetical protein
MMDSSSTSSVLARTSKAGPRACAVLVIAFFMALAGPAFAKKRVVVLGFAGPQAGKAEAAVTAAVKKKSTVVSAASYKKAKKKLKIKKLTDKNQSRIAQEIGVDAIVSGKVARKGTKWSLTVTVREGVSGKVKATVKIALRSPRIDARAKKDIAGKVPGAIAKTRPIAGAEEEEEEIEEEAPADDEEEVSMDEADPS